MTGSESQAELTAGNGDSAKRGINNFILVGTTGLRTDFAVNLVAGVQK